MKLYSNDTQWFCATNVQIRTHKQGEHWSRLYSGGKCIPHFVVCAGHNYKHTTAKCQQQQTPSSSLKIGCYGKKRTTKKLNKTNKKQKKIVVHMRAFVCVSLHYISVWCDKNKTLMCRQKTNLTENRPEIGASVLSRSQNAYYNFIFMPVEYSHTPETVHTHARARFVRIFMRRILSAEYC